MHFCYSACGWVRKICVEISHCPPASFPQSPYFLWSRKYKTGPADFVQKIKQSLMLRNLHHALWTPQEHVALVSPKHYFSSKCWHHHGYQQKSVKFPTTCDDHAFLIAIAKLYCSCLLCIAYSKLCFFF